MSAVEIFLLLIGVYVLIGVIFGIWFVLRGVQHDPAARPSRLGFRLLILPGSVALWPFLLTYRGPGGAAMTHGQRRWHLQIWLVLTPLLALGLALAWWSRAEALP